MKKCTRCGIEKSDNDFYPEKKRDGSVGLRTYCKDCIRKGNKVSNKKSKDMFNIWLNSIERVCVKCRENRGYLIEFHHINPLLKQNQISRIKSMSASFKKKVELATKELEKCVPLCANCHREFHHLERVSDMDLDEYLGGK